MPTDWFFIAESIAVFRAFRSSRTIRGGDLNDNSNDTARDQCQRWLSAIHADDLSIVQSVYKRYFHAYTNELVSKQVH